MPPSVLSQPTTFSGANTGAWKSIRKHLNFYRVHILFFTFTPLICSGIFYASNGRYKISYIDSLFNCVSAMTVCGLATVDLSSLTGFQQALLFVQMCLGSPVVVSWVMVFIRRYYFGRKFDHIVEAARQKNAGTFDEEKAPLPRWSTRIATFFHPGRHISIEVEESNEGSDRSKDQKGGIIGRLRPDMIRRMDDAPKLVNPSGWVSDGKAPIRKMPSIQSRQEGTQRLSVVSASSDNEPKPSNGRSISIDAPPARRARRLSDPGISSRPSSPVSAPMHRYDTVAGGLQSSLPKGRQFRHTQTVEFVPSAPIRRNRFESSMLSPVHEPIQSPERGERRSVGGFPFAPHLSINTHATAHTQFTHFSQHSRKHRDFGGFPMPWHIIHSLFMKFFPKVKRKLERTVTIPATVSYVSGVNAPQEGEKQVPYISFDAVVGRNSKFHALTSDQLDEIGGVEYRALNALIWIVPVYHFGIQLICFAVIAPYIAQKRWRDVLVPPQQHRPLRTAWFSAFQVVSAYTNTGMSLVDQSMIPFQHAYPMIVFLAFLILAGNTAFPIFLRFFIWILTKIVPNKSRTNETLHFLLDHPRRCFIYLFPSHQTWFLVTIVLSLTFTDWFFFMVLDIGNDAIEKIPLNVRFLIGFLQAVAVRAAGFGAVTLSALAPGVKVLYVIMMYISVYPIAMSVRSTNVYEEQSLGVFPDEDPDPDSQTVPQGQSRMTIWSRYLAMHARKQLAFDMWWLGLALFLVCIIERSHIDDPDTLSWFSIFTIVFELVSAYGTVGLSLGMPTQNYSLSGAFHPLSKLIVCLVMIRGRHRGLPVAIDRAVMLPSEFQKNLDNTVHEEMSPYEQQHGGYPLGVTGTMASRQSKYTSDNEQHYRRRRANTRTSNGDIYDLPEGRERSSNDDNNDRASNY
ncbi:cation transport protein-domain-containing protein [Crucibulum laeve]|uniref:Potassium transport protein n=1 Tax=Crucibulum laeve TaxID=68775 RepID=A0A5C3MHM3_9AGAR|nr:cation transport protein-domain-containing protein [Crucibulum laeve]